MKRRMTDTQLESWDQLQEFLPEKRRRVFGEIRSRIKATEFQVAKALGVPTHYVSGMITRLRDDGIVADSGERTINPASGRSVILWTLPKHLPKLNRAKPDKIKCAHCKGKGFITQERLF